MSLIRIFQNEFRRQITATLLDIRRTREQNKKRFELDRERIMNELIQKIEPLKISHKYTNELGKPDDFNIAAVDGSGVYPLVTIEDIDIIVESYYLAVHNTGTNERNLFHNVSKEENPNFFSKGHLETKWISQDDGEPIRYIHEQLIEYYPVYDDTNNRIEEPTAADFQKIINTYYEEMKKHYNIENKPLFNEDMLIEGITISAANLFSTSMRIGELGIAKRAIVEGSNLRYMLLDGSLSFKYDPTTMLPTDIIGYLLRDILKTARDHNVIVMAVSKTHTIPFTNEAIAIANEIFGNNSRWYIRLPGGIPSEQGLRILENRRYIPPPLTVPYLVQLDPNKPTLRVDFDALWWRENIYDEDINTLHENEHQIFQDLDFMSRGIYWVGYPAPLAVAHNNCKISRDTERILYNMLIEIATGLGFNSNLFLNQRELIHIR